MSSFSKRFALLLVLALCFCSHYVQAEEPQGKWIHYGKNTVNANQHGQVSLLNPIANADEAKVAAMIKEANGPIPMTIGIQFSKPDVMLYTMNTRVSDPKLAVEASRKANTMYQAIQKFLQSGETYLDLGE